MDLPSGTVGMDAAIAAVMPERANMHSAMEWAIERGDFTSALRLVTAVPLDLTGRRRPLIVDLIERGQGRHPPRVVAQAQAQAHAVRERRYRELGSPIMRAHALERRGLIEHEAGDLEAARPFLREAMAVLSGSGNLGCTAHTLEAVAVWSAEGGDAEAAGERVGAAESLRAASGAGHKPWEVRARHAGDYDAKVLGDPEAAREAVDRGRLHSLASTAALADALLSASRDTTSRSGEPG